MAGLLFTPSGYTISGELFCHCTTGNVPLITPSSSNPWVPITASGGLGFAMFSVVLHSVHLASSAAAYIAGGILHLGSADDRGTANR